ncbi:hypothetical protein [Variovorax sp. DAIF25]|uniref:hypothetical protein n=1 Tax=Variovorax sp. DAIF25 TaxID=3080983 RepID=UPI003D6B1EDF
MTRTTTAKPARTAASSAQLEVDASTAATPENAPKAVARPRLGEMVHVAVAEGVRLKNNETGAFFVAGVPTPQTVTATTLRRLDDGDFEIVDASI